MGKGGRGSTMTTAMMMTTPIISHRLYELIWKFMQQQGRESSWREGGGRGEDKTRRKNETAKYIHKYT